MFIFKINFHLIKLLILGISLVLSNSLKAQQTPYNGPHNIPGTIEAEDFDEGGQDVSYHDFDLGKTANATVSNYRNPDGTKNLDIEILSGGFSNSQKVGWMNAGDWLEYTFNATETDDYIVTVTTTARNAAAGENKGYQLFLDGVSVSEKINVNPTNDWYSEWLDLSSEFNITQGEHVLRIEIYSEHGHALDLDKIEFKSKSVAALTPLSVNSLIRDNAILQRNTQASVWGKGEPGNEVTIEPEWGDQLTTTIDANGKWSVKIPTIDAGGSYTLKISDVTKSFNFNNIALGEVWLCAGQSNMDQPLKVWGVVENADEEIANSNYPNLRMFTIGRSASYDEEEEVNSGFWRVSTPTQSKFFSAVAYFFAKELHTTLNIPIGIIVAARGDSDAESWTTANSIKDVPGYETILADLEEARNTPDSGPYRISHVNDSQQGFRTPGGLYNGMIAPILPYTIKGAAWYQGESNTGKASEYEQVFTALIEQWRSAFEIPEMPFYYVQIAPFTYNNNNSAFLREAQFFVKDVPNTGMSVTIDLGEQFDIHPKFKSGVGKRLAFWPLAKDYAQNIVASGPIYKSSEFKDGKGILSFEYDEGLKLASGDAKFEIAGADGVFKPATAEVNGTKLEVSSSEVTKPIQVRYAWENWIEKGVLRNGADLPSSSFKTYNAYAFSDSYDINQENLSIDVGNNGSSITTTTFLSNLTTVTGATLILIDASGTEVTSGNISEDYIIKATMDNEQDEKQYAIKFGSTVDTAGNFLVKTVSETCASSNNGKLNIVADKVGNYAVEISKTGFVKNLDFDKEATIEDLSAGKYKIVITDKNTGQSYTYEIEITEPENLEVFSSINGTDGNIEISLSGGSIYSVNFNGSQFHTSQESLSLALQNGQNSIEIKADKDCQGVFKKDISFYETIQTYPNPVKEELAISFPITDEGQANIFISDVSGKVVYSKSVLIINHKFQVRLNDLKEGLYFVKVETENNSSTSKIVKH